MSLWQSEKIFQQIPILLIADSVMRLLHRFRLNPVEVQANTMIQLNTSTKVRPQRTLSARLVYFRPLAAFSLLTVGLMWSNVVAQAQTVAPEQAAKYWKQIEAQDARISSVQSNWQQVRTRPAVPGHDAPGYVETKAEQAVEKARAEGLSEESVKIRAEVARSAARIVDQGYSTRVGLAFVRIGSELRVNQLSGSAQYPGITASEKAQTFRNVDYYDAKTGDALSISEVQAPVPAEEQPENQATPKMRTLLQGLLTRKPKTILANTTPGFEAPFLFAGAPITSEFTPTNSKLSEGEDDTIVLKKLSEDGRFQQTLTLSKEFWRPLAAEVAFADDGQKLAQIQANGYRGYPGDIWFPTEVVQLSFVNKKSFVSSRSRLQETVFNADVNANLLRFPKLVKVRDERFEIPVTYDINGQLAPEEAVLKLIAKQKQAQAQLQPKGGQQQAIPAQVAPQPTALAARPTMAPLLGLALMALGCTVWMRSNKSDKT